MKYACVCVCVSGRLARECGHAYAVRMLVPCGGGVSLHTCVCVPAAGCGFSECPMSVYWRPCPAADPLGHCVQRRLLQNWQDEIEKLKTGCGGHEKPLMKTTLSGKETNSITNCGQSPLCWGLRDRCSPTEDPLGWDSQGPTAYSGLRALPPE